jgi:hypothetical protein
MPLSDYRYTSTAAITAARAARATYEAGQPATASLPKSCPLLAVVGDMVNEPDNKYRDAEEGTPVISRHLDVSNLVVSSNCTWFCNLGDNVYLHGELANFQTCYEVSFGRVKAKTLPMPGNHEYDATTNASGYFTYFGNRAGLVNASGAGGYYAVNIANWRYYVINAMTSTAQGGAQASWLEADLAKAKAETPPRPAIVGWHHPRWTDGLQGVVNYPGVDYLWQIMYAAGNVQIALAGHDHNYQRWDTIKTTTPAGNYTGLQGNGTDYPPTTVADGITQFIVGCGGNNFFQLSPGRPGTILPLGPVGGAGPAGGSTWGIDNQFGVLFLRLGPASWDFMFKSVDGVIWDQGTRTTHFH